MKKSFILAMAVCAAIATVSSCRKDNGGDTPPPPEVVPSEGILVSGFYGADFNESGAGNIWINFSEGELFQNEYDEITGTGQVICVDFNIPLASDPDFVKIPDGTYEVSLEETYAEGEINGGDSYVISAENDKLIYDYVPFKSGSATFETIENIGYKVTLDIVLDNGDALAYEYIGPIRPRDGSGEGKGSNLTADVEIAGLTQGSMTYWGDITEMGTSECWAVSLGDKDYDLLTDYGLGQSLLLYLNVPIDTPDDNLPAGNFKGLVAFGEEEAPAWTGFKGLSMYGAYLGCWYMHLEEQYEASLVDGEVEVKLNGDIYTISGALKDGHGNTISFKYEGELRKASIEGMGMPAAVRTAKK